MDADYQLSEEQRADADQFAYEMVSWFMEMEWSQHIRSKDIGKIVAALVDSTTLIPTASYIKLSEHDLSTPKNPANYLLSFFSDDQIANNNIVILYIRHPGSIRSTWAIPRSAEQVKNRDGIVDNVDDCVRTIGIDRAYKSQEESEIVTWLKKAIIEKADNDRVHPNSGPALLWELD